MKPWLFRLKAVFSKTQLDHEFESELQDHLELLTEEYEAQGLPRPEARRAALLKLGPPEELRESHRDQRGLPTLEALAQDLSFAVRTLWKSRGFTTIAVLSLALGIGANTALFSLVDRLLLRSLPVKDPDSLVYVQRLVLFPGLKGFGKPSGFDRPTFDAIKGIPGVFSEVMGANPLDRPVIVIDGEIEPSHSGLVVTDNFFSGLGVDLSLGRAEPNGAVISDRFWKSRFGKSPDVLGRLLNVNGQTYSIAGVAPPSFQGISLDFSGDVWLVAPTVPENVFTAIGRLRPGVQIGQAQAATDALFQQLDRSGTRLPGKNLGMAIRADVQPAAKGSSNLRDQYQHALLALMVLVTLVLLITCTNIGNLLVVRNTSRIRELTVRAAVGARRSRLIAQLLVESAVLALMGGSLAWVVARWGVSTVLSMLPLTEIPELLVFRMDARILGFLAGVSVLSAVLFALAPAWRATRIDLATGLKAGLQGGSGTATARDSRWLGRWLVAGQIALSVMLLAGAGLFLQSLRNLGEIAPGFETRDLLQVEIDTSFAGYRQGHVNTVYKLLLDRLASIPRVREVTGGRNPLLGSYPPGMPPPPNYVSEVDARFFDVMRIPLQRGRIFTLEDETRAEPIAIVSEAYAKETFPGEDAIGKSIPAGRISREIVGVVADSRLMSLRWDVPMVYYPLLQGEADRISAIEIRTSGDPVAIAHAVQDEVRRVNPRLLISVRTMQDVIDRSMAQERLVGAVSGFFGVLGVILAGIGLFGVASFTVAQRTSELGIRIALGAGRWDVIRESLRDTALVFGIGLVIGGAAAFAGTRLAANLISGLLYGLSATDWRNIAAAGLLMIVVAIAACLIPALRAARVDPLKAIRYE
jgi:predicted permease